MALTPPNIISGRARTGQYPFDPNRVLQDIDIQQPSAPARQSIPAVDTASVDKPLLTPVTSEHLMSLRRTIKQNLHTLDLPSHGRPRMFANATERAMSARDLLLQENSDLLKQPKQCPSIE